MYSLICPCTNSWVNNREAGYLIRYATHYDVTVCIMQTTKHRSFISLPHRLTNRWHHKPFMGSVAPKDLVASPCDTMSSLRKYIYIYNADMILQNKGLFENSNCFEICSNAFLWQTCVTNDVSQIASFTCPTWDPPGSCRPQVGPMFAPWTLLSGIW